MTSEVHSCFIYFSSISLANEHAMWPADVMLLLTGSDWKSKIWFFLCSAVWTLL
jgi:hypothetical protein